MAQRGLIDHSQVAFNQEISTVIVTKEELWMEGKSKSIHVKKKKKNPQIEFSTQSNIIRCVILNPNAKIQSQSNAICVPIQTLGDSAYLFA